MRSTAADKRAIALSIDDHLTPLGRQLAMAQPIPAVVSSVTSARGPFELQVHRQPP